MTALRIDSSRPRGFDNPLIDQRLFRRHDSFGDPITRQSMGAKKRQHFPDRQRQHLLARIRRFEIHVKRPEIPDGMEGGPQQVLDGFPDGGPVQHHKHGEENRHPQLSAIPPAAMNLFFPLHAVRSFPLFESSAVLLPVPHRPTLKLVHLKAVQALRNIAGGGFFAEIVLRIRESCPT